MSISRSVYGTFTLFGLSSQIIPLPSFQHRLSRSSARCPPLPVHSNGFALFHYVLLGSSLFARHYSENLFRFLFLQVLRCFTSLGSPPVFQALSGSPIRISTDLQSFASPRSFSQLTTSFFASCCLGILRMPLSLWTLCTCQVALSLTLLGGVKGT